MVQRSEARALVVQALYSIDVSKNDKQQVFSSLIKPKFRDEMKNLEFTENLFSKTLNHLPKLDAIIEQHAKNWKIERLATLDKAILRMALCEFIYFND